MRANCIRTEENILFRKRIIFLGSSVSYGSAAGGHSFIEELVKRDKICAVKETVSGTTLTDTNDQSYVSRLKRMDPGLKPDLFVCQLSSNDAANMLPLGKISKNYTLDEFDTSTIVGALEYIICYVQKTWDCPVIFFTGTRFDNALYGQMVRNLISLQGKWKIGVINLWDNEEMNKTDEKSYALYMEDSIHPTLRGYREWWTPVIERDLIREVGRFA